MTAEELRKTLNQEEPEANWSGPIQALWWDAKGDWDKAHEVCQAAASTEGDWVHAYLHRKEGDLSNAGYWYGRAGKPRHGGSLEEEWADLVSALG